MEAKPPAPLVSEYEVIVRHETLLERIRDSLDDGEFEHFELAVIEALPHKEIGERLGMTADMSRTWKRRILDKLKRELSDLKPWREGRS